MALRRRRALGSIDMLDVEQNRLAQKYRRGEMLRRVLWIFIQPLFRFSPRPCFGWRRFLLRCLGAKIGRNVVDNFETAIERDGRDRGYIVAFSFTRGAHEEAARAKAQAKVEIELVTVADLLTSGTPDLSTGELLPDLPLPKPRPAAARPTVEELVESDQT